MPKTIQERFFNDPEWYQVTELIEKFLEPLRTNDTIDMTQSGEYVKAEIIVRRLLCKQLDDFCEQSKLLIKPKVEMKKSPFT